MSKVKFIIALTCVLIMTTVSGCNRKIVLTSGFKEDEVVRMDKNSITAQELMLYIMNDYSGIESMYGTGVLNNEAVGDGIADDIKNSSLARVYKVKVMCKIAAKYKVKLNENERKLAKEAAKEYYEALNKEQVKLQFDISQKDIENAYMEYALAYKLYEHLAKDVDLEVSDDEARTVVVKVLTIRTGERTDAEAAGLANLALNAFNAEVPCDDIIKEYSDGGVEEYEYMRDNLPENAADAVFNLAEGQHTEVIAGTDGYYIYYCVNPFSRVGTDKAKADIINERKDEAFYSVYNGFAEKETYYINEELWKSIEYDGEAGLSVNFFDIYGKYFGN